MTSVVYCSELNLAHVHVSDIQYHLYTFRYPLKRVILRISDLVYKYVPHIAEIRKNNKKHK